MEGLIYEKGKNIKDGGENNSNYSEYKAKLKKELDYFSGQFKAGIIDKDKFIEIKNQIIEFWKEYEGEKSKIEAKYSSLKQEILTETGLKLSENKDVQKTQLDIYEYYGIDKHTYKNSTKNRFIKGTIDVYIIDNYELIKQIQEKGFGIISDIIDSLTSWEGIKSIAKAFGESVWNIFDGDAYERGKSFAELGIYGAGAGLIVGGVGTVIKKVTKLGIKNAGKQTKKGVIKNIIPPIKPVDNITREVTEEIVGSVDDIAKEVTEEFVGSVDDISKTTAEITVDSVDNIPEKTSGRNIDVDIISSENIDEIIGKLEDQKVLDKVEIEALDMKIITNNPALGIFDRLKGGDNFQSIIFTGVKGVNDTFSQAFTDSILKNFKQGVLKKYPGVNPVWDDYKNFVLKVDDGVTIQSTKELNAMLERAYKNEIGILTPNELKTIQDKLKLKQKEMPKINCIAEDGVIKGKTQKDIMLSLAEKRSKLETKALGKVVVSTGKLIEKLGEIRDKYNLKGNFEEVIYQKRDRKVRTIYTTKNGVLQKEFTITLTGEKVIDRMLILDSKGNINPKIINLVRKNEIPNNLSVYKDVEQVIKSAIANGEFIGPYIRKKGLKNGDLISPEFLKNYKKIKYKLSKGKPLSKNEIKTLKEMGEKTYKNALYKENFYHKINKPGELFFIDIVGMGNINIADFLNELEKHSSGISKIEKAYKSGKISKKAFQKAIKGLKEKLFLDSGSIMTLKFQKLLVSLKNEIGKLYPGQKIDFYVGGDEIGIFIGGVKVSNNEIVKVINKCLDDVLLEGRTTKKLVKKQDLSKGGKKLFEKIDKLTNYSKIIENRIDETIQKIQVKLKKMIIDNSAELLSKLEMLKKFEISSIEGEKIITFHPPDGMQLFANGNIFKLNEIVNLKTHKLKSYPGSPFIDYLKRHNLER